VELGLQARYQGDYIAPGGALGSIPSQPWRRGALDALPYAEESDTRDVVGRKMGRGDGLLSSSSPFFLKVLLFFSFLAASFREKKRRVWKDLQTGYKT
jgi:hypothetical protein